MKKRLIPVWLLGFAMLGGVSTASAQQATQGTVSQKPALASEKPKADRAATKVRAVRSVVDIEKDIETLKVQLAEKRKIAGYNLLPYEQKLEQLENELKIAKRANTSKP